MSSAGEADPPIVEQPAVKEKKPRAPKEKKPKQPKTASHPPYFQVLLIEIDDSLLILIPLP